MENCIKCCKEVQEDEGHRLSSVQDHVDAISSGSGGCFCAVVRSESRLCYVKQLVVGEVVAEAYVDEFL